MLRARWAGSELPVPRGSPILQGFGGEFQATLTLASLKLRLSTVGPGLGWAAWPLSTWADSNRTSPTSRVHGL